MSRATKQRRVGILQQADFATAKANTDDFESLAYDAGSVKINKNVIQNISNLTSTDGWMQKQSQVYVDKISGLKTIDFTGPATLKQLALHFAAALQNVDSEAATTPYQKEMSPAVDTDLPDFTSGGYLFSIATDNVQGSDGEILDSAILNTFTFEIDFNAEGYAKLAKISGQWIGKSMQNALDLSGTWVAQDTTGLFNDTSGFTLSTSGITSLSDYCKKKYTLTINNNVVVDCRANSAAANYRTPTTITTSVSLPYDSTTYATMTDYLNATQGTITLSTGSTGVSGYLNLVSYGKISVDPRSVDGDFESIDLTINHNVDTSAGKSLAVSIADATDRSW